MNKMLMKEKSVEKEKRDWVISESYLSQIWCELIKASILFSLISLDMLVTLTCWITIIKRELKEKMIKYKARWMCKRFCQKQRIDYDEIFTSMIRVMIIKMLLALMIKYDYEVEQMNVVIAFLEAHLKMKIWVQQSLRFKQK